MARTTRASFLIFLAVLVLCLAMGWSVAWAIAGGVILFFFLGLHLGFRPAELWKMAWEKGKTALIVLRVLLLIGIITGMWRASGTIAYCVYYGVKLITPHLFILLAFLLTAALSYALGTSFGVASTAGVIFMALARSGGVQEVVAAGAVLSGVYFGDRCSPVSSSANLVAAVTGTDLYRNVRQMMLTALPAMGLTILFYLFLSLTHPLSTVDAAALDALSQNFQLVWPALLPAAAILLLPLFRIPITWTMVVSILLSALVGWSIQGLSPVEMAVAAVSGYHPGQAALAAVMEGGGLVSMFSAYVTVLCASLYTGILEGIGVLAPLKGKLLAASERYGRLPVMLGTAVISVAVFCNQSVAVLLGEQLLHPAYPSREELAMDIENTGITMSALVPWAVSCSVPLAMMGAGYGALPYAVLLWLIPLCYLPTKRWFYPADRKE